MKKIIADSSCDIASLDKEYKNVSFERVPLTIMIERTSYVDDFNLDINLMMQHMETYKGKSSTACPSPFAWVEASKDADEVFFVTITSGLSGSYNSALVAKDMIEEIDPSKKIYVVDSLATSSKNVLIIHKLAELLEKGVPFEEICGIIENYKNNTKLNFILFSIDNLVKNGRVGKITGIAASALNINLIGEASGEGTLTPLCKGRGLTKSLNLLLNTMKMENYNGGKVVIAHAFNEFGAIKLKENILTDYPKADISIIKCSGLCSYYSERNGILVGYEI